MSAPTPGQTVGPFFGYALPYGGGNLLVPRDRPDAIRLHGRVIDGAGEPVPDALVEVWQPDNDGRVIREAGSLRRDGRTFTGWGRAATAADGEYEFTTVEPGSAEPGRAAFFAITVFARGLLDRLFTRAYLPDQRSLASDPLLAGLPEARQASLIATRDAGGFRFDIVLQGTNETVFLDLAGDRS
ncbi:protocatechuate 3,4-dioxygenase subunit alpha [Solicola gregarius]|uniref:Protocatechuate 3,4-dioxygenase subunit alpha n=1 Tax=Solicola gregarius TaxID=2908642 RepID=A0AA46TK08_9ACTN|nr:protocatechuate 3,4-dioxygenase subunit alpha [Solicola gregarius]UYM06742.1 protocatechuate 3,4-dioxygenase subunit alpha [Solicola gregarius]